MNKVRLTYIRIYEKMREDIVNRIYPFGGKLPSKRTLASEEGVSVISVEHAYALLCEEGYVEARQRSGYFVIFSPDEYFSRTESRATELFRSHSSGEKHRFPVSVLTKTMRRVISEYGDGILTVSQNSGCPELRQAIVRYLTRSRGISADADQVIIGSGSEYLYSLIVGLLGRERVYGIEAPSYDKIERVYASLQVSYESLPLNSNGIDSKALWQSNAQVLHISPYRSFPSGASADATKRHEYMRWASENDRYIVEDDFESEFSVLKKHEETLFAQSELGNVIYMNSFSKTVSSALRVGYMVLPKSLLSSFSERLGFYSCTVPTYIQLVLAELINNGDFERHINRVRRQKRRELSGRKE